MKSDAQIEELIQVNPFIRTLALLRQGGFVTELTEKFPQVIEAVKRTGTKGRLTLTLDILPDDKGEVRTVDILGEVKLKLPERKKKATTFFVVGDRSLSQTGIADDQPELDFDTKAKPAAPAPITKMQLGAAVAASK